MPPHFWTSEAPVADLPGPFCGELVRQVRAHDAYGLWDGKPDLDLLAPFVIDRQKIPLIGNPDPAVLTRIGQFYGAVALMIERRCGIMAAPVIQISAEGFGRAVLTAGRLVVATKTLRDVHRFGFSSLQKLEAAGSALVEDGLSWIAKFKDAATAD
jgi:probable nitrogen fixation protein